MIDENLHELSGITLEKDIKHNIEIRCGPSLEEPGIKGNV